MSEHSGLKQGSYTWWQLSALVVLRILIGWHCLYEGIVKLADPNWSAGGYLMDSEGFMEGFFHSLANNEVLLQAVDLLNIWGLILIGLGLIVGLFTRGAVIGGILLLSLYYLSHPPLIGVDYALPSEGNYLFINKTLIEIFALIVLLVFPTGRYIGLDRVFHIMKKAR